MHTLYATFMVVMGAAIVLIWIMELVMRPKPGPFFKWKEGENIMWPHIIVELLTGIMLITAGIGTFARADWGSLLGFYSMGALFYASFNSLSWSFAIKKRWPYSLPMIVGMAGSVTFLVAIISELVG